MQHVMCLEVMHKPPIKTYPFFPMNYSQPPIKLTVSKVSKRISRSPVSGREKHKASMIDGLLNKYSLSSPLELQDPGKRPTCLGSNESHRTEYDHSDCVTS